jgi:hypothetical protein
MPEGADGSAYYGDGTRSTGGAGVFLGIIWRLPASNSVCRTGAGGCAGLSVPGSLHASCPGVRPAHTTALADLPTHQTHDAGQPAGQSDLRRRILPVLEPLHTAHV